MKGKKKKGKERKLLNIIKIQDDKLVLWWSSHVVILIAGVFDTKRVFSLSLMLENVMMCLRPDMPFFRRYFCNTE